MHAARARSARGGARRVGAQRSGPGRTWRGGLGAGRGRTWWGAAGRAGGGTAAWRGGAGRGASRATDRSPPSSVARQVAFLRRSFSRRISSAASRLSRLPRESAPSLLSAPSFWRGVAHMLELELMAALEGRRSEDSDRMSARISNPLGRREHTRGGGIRRQHAFH